MTREKEIQLEPIVDRILDLHLKFGKRYLNEESPKSVGAIKITEIAAVNHIRGLYMQERIEPTRRARYTRKCPYQGPSVL